ncbi:hypothetical protein NQ314_021105 [Rhamnusium bicolor]|uniref:Uncharacterized protein n=1 Tax=Rhamnusium bicolor TaxID=1586634 RepID=A0AAV8WJK5_9CUCU|nr:hypothetical protein NQ314_021105 [Rhamnusium bicolor]
MEDLYLTNNSLTELDYTLLKWTDLRIFELRDNSLECDCNLYKISKDLNEGIIRNLDGPVCTDPRDDISRPAYYLDGDICNLVSTFEKN